VGEAADPVRWLHQDSAYESRDGFSPRIWGPPLWLVLHIISFNYPVRPTAQDKEHYRQFIESLQFVLPCRACRENYPKNLEAVGWGPSCLVSRHAFSRFVYRLHNEVSRATGVGCLPVSYYDLREIHECFRAKCSPPSSLPASEGGCLVPREYVPARVRLQVIPYDAEDPSPPIEIEDGVFRRGTKRKRID